MSRPILYDHRSVAAQLRYRPRLSIRRFHVSDPDRAQLWRDVVRALLTANTVARGN